MDENVKEPNRRRRGLIVLLLLLVAGATVVTVALSRDHRARPAAESPDGTGTVDVTPTPTPSGTVPPSGEPTAAPTPVPTDTTPGTPGTGSDGSGTGTVGGGSGGSTDGPLSGVFYLSGGVAGLRPGVPATMTIQVRNPNAWAFQLLSLDTTVGTADRAHCPAGTLSVGRYAFNAGDAKILAPAGTTITVTVPVELIDSMTVDQSGCRGATFPLTFHGTGVRASA